jgi:aryl-alcohol dehydrogenase-like predicted oxidoreductase
VTALNGVKIRTLYLHKPDRSVPFEETVSAIDELHKQGILCARSIISFSTLCVKKTKNKTKNVDLEQ